MAVDPNSILDTIKKALGMEPEFTAFDPELVMHINSVFSTLHQLGVGTPYFSIMDRAALWSEFILPNTNLNNVKSYIFMKVKLMFDPPQSSYPIQSIEKMCVELEWRLNVQVETEALNVHETGTP